MYSDTMLLVYLKETFTNEFEPVNNETAATADDASSNEGNDTIDLAAAIIGDDSLYPFDESEYTIKNADNGVWSVSNVKAKINNQTTQSVIITIVTAKSGSVDLIYTMTDGTQIAKTIIIKSL